MIGIDEVGRGAWAGPLLVVAARLKPGQKLPLGLRDSKLLSAKQRQSLAVEIVKSCDIGQGWVSADIIDKLGLSRSLKSATMLAVMDVAVSKNEEIVIDGNINFLDSTSYVNVRTKVKADQTLPIVSAASVVAKVLRDQLMVEISQKYPDYNFQKNVGYGTANHRQALSLFGPCRVHRNSFKPIKALVANG